MKKWMLWLLVAAALLAFGCGGKKDKDTKPASEGVSTEAKDGKKEEKKDAPKEDANKKEEKTSETKSAEPVKVTYWYAGGKTAVGVMQEIVDAFNASQSDYKVETTTQADYTETFQKLQAAVAGKKAPDIALLDVERAQALFDKGLLEDLRPMMGSDFPEKDYLAVFFDQGKSKDAVFALPAYGTTQVLYYNKAAFQAAGIAPESIKTWQDLAEAARKITKPDGSMIGWEPMWGPDNLVDAALSNGAKLLSDDGKKLLIDGDDWVEVWESFRKWIHDDKIMKVHSGGQGWEYWYKTMDDVLQDKAGGYTGSSGDQADLDFSKVAALEQPGFGKHPSRPAANALQIAMLKTEDDAKKKAAFAFMQFMTSPEMQAKWSMATGYVAVRQSTVETPEFKTYTETHPQALVPMRQASHGTPSLQDPTGGKIFDALKIAADKVELENVPAKDALTEAQKAGQAALDAVSGK